MEQARQWWEQHRTIAVAAAVVVALLGALAWQQLQAKPQPLAVTDAKPAEATGAEIVVDVEGAVAVPGVRRLPADSLIEDALTAAGGLTEQADQAKVAKDLNRADKLKNGQKVYIPPLGESTVAKGSAGSSSGSGTGGSSEVAGSASGGTINLNSASQAELEDLPGVGPATAKKIIDHRESKGPFTAIEGLMDVSGIGEATFEKLKDRIAV